MYALQKLKHASSVRRVDDGVTLVLQDLPHQDAQYGFVVDDEDSLHHASSTDGSAGTARPVSSPEAAPAKGLSTTIPWSLTTNDRMVGSVPICRDLRTETRRCKVERISTWRNRMPLSIVAEAAGTGTTS